MDQNADLVLCPGYIDGLSEFVRVPGKARPAGNGCSLSKGRNADQGRGQTHPQGALMASRRQR